MAIYGLLGLKGGLLSSGFSSTDRILISASAVPHCAGWGGGQLGALCMGLIKVLLKQGVV